MQISFGTGLATLCRAACLGGLLSLTSVVTVGLGAEPSGTHRIYRCEQRGQITFSDRPCAQVPSVEVSLPRLNSYHADDLPNSSSRKSAKLAPSREGTAQYIESIAAQQRREQQRCQRLADQLVSIRSKMRLGYTASQGEKLRERQRQLEQRRRTEHCR